MKMADMTMGEIFDELSSYEIAEASKPDFDYIKSLIKFRFKSKDKKLGDRELATLNIIFAIKWFQETHDVVGWRRESNEGHNG